MMFSNRTLSRWALRLGGALLPLATALALLTVIGFQPSQPFEPAALTRVAVDRVEQLEAVFAAHDYHWPPAAAVPRLLVARIPSALATVAVGRKKSLFFRALLPVVLAENDRIRRQRRLLKQVDATAAVGPGSRVYDLLQALAREYRVEGDPGSVAVRRQLLLRVDTVPPALVLAQAANESAWGTSRFAREGNNLFGQWTWNPDAGMVPLRRTAGADHLVRVFPDLRSSVRAYLHNLNTGAAYRDLRRRRAVMRLADEPLDPLVLAMGLQRYSERGAAYVAELQAMIRHNGLNRLGPLRLAE